MFILLQMIDRPQALPRRTQIPGASEDRGDVKTNMCDTHFSYEVFDDNIVNLYMKVSQLEEPTRRIGRKDSEPSIL